MRTAKNGRLASGLSELVRLIIPVACPGCDRPDTPLCARCLVQLSGFPRRVDHTAVRLVRLDGSSLVPVWARASYAGTSREVILAWKARGRHDLTRYVERQGAGAARLVSPALRASVPLGTRLWVVPVPSTRRAVRRRGHDLVAELAQAVAAALSESGVPASARRAIARGRGRHQAGLSRAQRGINRAGALAWRRPPGPGPVLLVDDIVTTGASLAQVTRFLRAAGHEVVGAIVLAATPSRIETLGEVARVV